MFMVFKVEYNYFMIYYYQFYSCHVTKLVKY